MNRAYLDNASTTPILPEVRETMLPYLGEAFDNLSCVHDWADTAREAMEAARVQVAQLIGADAGEVIFTGSGIESLTCAYCDGTLSCTGPGLPPLELWYG